jgi:hypothetical protein
VSTFSDDPRTSGIILCSESDPTSFFRNTDYPNVDGQPDCSDIPVYSNNLSMGIPKVCGNPCSQVSSISTISDRERDLAGWSFPSRVL